MIELFPAVIGEVQAAAKKGVRKKVDSTAGGKEPSEIYTAMIEQPTADMLLRVS